MWPPPNSLEDINRAIISVEQKLLAALRGGLSLDEMARSSFLAQLFERVDQDPYTAVLMARIKSGHAMTPRHGINVMMTARAWAKSAHRLGNRLDDFSIAALFHDVGHWRPPDLLTIPGAFTHAQARQMQGHVSFNDQGLDKLHPDIRTWISQHHEQPDGKGYPKGITNPHPLAAIIRIVDCYEGLMTQRSIRNSYTAPKAMVIMKRWAGHKFDARLFQSFVQFMGTYPFGSFVMTKEKEGAITLPPTAENMPILVLTNKDGDPLEEPERRENGQEHIKEEAPVHRELPLTKPYRTLRPDLMALPRSYFTD